MSLADLSPSFTLRPRFGAAARFFARKPKSETFAAPAIVANPVKESERDGHLIFEPAGEVKSIGHVPYFHGFGGRLDERPFLHGLAAGKYGEHITVAAPLAEKIAPAQSLLANLKVTANLARFALSQLPPDARALLAQTATGENSSLIQQARNLVGMITAPPSWYPFAFEKTPSEKKEPSALSYLSSLWQSALKPDYDATLRSIERTSRHIVPRVRAVLDSLDATPGKICPVGFSQGVGMAAAFALLAPEDHVRHAVFVSGSYIETPNSLKTRRSSTEIDVILPADDPVSKILFPEERIRTNLADAFKRATLWTTCEGGHSMSGDIAKIAGQRIIEGLRRSHHGAQWVR